MNIKRKLTTIKQQMVNVPEFFIKLTLKKKLPVP